MMIRFASRFLSACAVTGLLLAAPGLARAFTFQDGEGGASGNSSGFRDLNIPKVPKENTDSRFSPGSNNTRIYQFGDGAGSLYFGSGRPSMNQQYSTEHLFNPYLRDGKY